MRIRLCEPKDRDALVVLTQAFMGDYLAAIVPPEFEALEQYRNLGKTVVSDVDRRLKVDSGVVRTLVAEENDGSLVGYITGRIEPHPEKKLGTWGLIEDWFVLEEKSQQGIGGALYAEMEAWLRESGCQQVRSNTWAFNALGRAVHEKLGFLIAGIEYRKPL